MYQLYLLFCLVHIVNSANILTVSIFPSYSHQKVYQGLWEELAIRGHNVTSITTNPIQNSLPNLQEIDISFAYKIWTNERSVTSKNPRDLIATDNDILTKISKEILILPVVQQLIKQSNFDLVIAEWINPTIFGFSAVFKCPLIGISSLELIDTLSLDIGNPIHPIVHPSFFLPFKSATTFWERLESVATSIWLQYLFHFNIYPTSNEIIRSHMGENLPTVQEIIKNVSAVFVNSNFLFSKPRSNMQNVIEFSGLHINKPKPLPKDIQTFLDGATQGAIYCSLGSYIKSSMLTKELKNIIFSTLNELPYKVLWKFEDDNITTASKNILILKWLPQQDILDHSNLKVFITQGGLQSTEEAIRKRVPMVGIPFFLDQPKNVETMAKLGIGKYVDKSNITKEVLKRTIIEVAENSIYREKISELSNLLEDEPIKSKDKLLWWIEYTLRHKGAHHLRSPYLEVPWYQFLLLDVLLFITSCVLTAILALYLILKVTLQLTQSKKQKKE